MYYIYALIGADDAVFYVGKSNNPSRRATEHKATFGFKPKFIILETCGSDGRFVEHKWIQYYRDAGANLLNQTAGGNGLETHSAKTRALISEIQIGRKKPPGVIKKISDAQRGVPKEWSAAGKIRVKSSQFKRGKNSLENLTPETLNTRAAKISAAVSALGSEERARRNRVGWAAMTEEQRAERGRKIAAGQRAGGKVAAANQTPEARAASSRGSKNFWATMTPEYRVAYLARRQAARKDIKPRT